MYPSRCIVSALLASALLSACNTEVTTPATNAQKDIHTLQTNAQAQHNLHAAAAHTPLPQLSVAAAPKKPSTPSTKDCLTNSLHSDSIYCRGSRAIRNIIKNLNRMDKPLVLMRGLEIVPVKSLSSSSSSSSVHKIKSAASAAYAGDDDSFLACVSDYLRNHELNIKFSDLLVDDESEGIFAAARDFQHSGGVNEQLGSGFEEARKKDKGQGIILAMAMMFGKMMAVMSMGGIGALALKALGVAMTALMMAGIVGLKSLMKGGESTHSVQYLSGGEGYHHMRRRRSSRSADYVDDPMAMVYSGWLKEQQQRKVSG